MKILSKTVVSTIPPKDTNVWWLDVSSINNPKLKAFLSVGWKSISAGKEEKDINIIECDDKYPVLAALSYDGEFSPALIAENDGGFNTLWPVQPTYFVDAPNLKSETYDVIHFTAESSTEDIIVCVSDDDLDAYFEEEEEYTVITGGEFVQLEPGHYYHCKSVKDITVSVEIEGETEEETVRVYIYEDVTDKMS